MNLEAMKRLIAKYQYGHTDFVIRAETGERYYRNETDIMFKEKKSEEEKALRNADNRIPRNFHGLIVNQKASYAFTAPPLFDVGNTKANKQITKILGDEYAKNCMELCVNAANCSVGWIHYWQGENEFEWAVVDSKQIIPVFDTGLKKKLLGVLRMYPKMDEENGDRYVVYEYWTGTECQTFRRNIADTIEEGLLPYGMFAQENGEPSSEYRHEWGLSLIHI